MSRLDKLFSSRVRRHAPWLAAPPALYGTVQLGYLLACTGQLPAEWHNELRAISHPLKWLTVLTIPLLIHHLADRMTRRPNLWWQASALWAVVGTVFVWALVPFAPAIAEASAKPDASRLWPGTEALASTQADAKFDAAYTVNRIVASELVAVVIIAMLIGLTFRLRLKSPWTAAGLVPIVAVLSLIGYSLMVPGGFIMDYDPFVGDVVLGGVLADLIIPVTPFDPIGAMAIGIAGLSMGGLLRLSEPPVGRTAEPSDQGVEQWA